MLRLTCSHFPPRLWIRALRGVQVCIISRSFQVLVHFPSTSCHNPRPTFRRNQWYVEREVLHRSPLSFQSPIKDNLDPHTSASSNDPDSFTRDATQDTGNAKDEDTGRKNEQNNRVPRPLPLDLVEGINGMYRLLDLISESGSNGCGKELFVPTE